MIGSSIIDPQPEQELLAKRTLGFEFKHLSVAFRGSLIRKAAVEQVMTGLEKHGFIRWATIAFNFDRELSIKTKI